MIKLLDGYKTYIAAIIAAFVALNGAFHFVDKETQDMLLALATGLGLYGLREAIKKVERTGVTNG